MELSHSRAALQVGLPLAFEANGLPNLVVGQWVGTNGSSNNVVMYYLAKTNQLVPEYLNHGCELLPRWRLIAGILLDLSPPATLPQPREANHD